MAAKKEVGIGNSCLRRTKHQGEFFEFRFYGKILGLVVIALIFWSPSQGFARFILYRVISYHSICFATAQSCIRQKDSEKLKISHSDVTKPRLKNIKKSITALIFL
jgi:hypothetical protein